VVWTDLSPSEVEKLERSRERHFRLTKEKNLGKKSEDESSKANIRFEGNYTSVLSPLCWYTIGVCSVDYNDACKVYDSTLSARKMSLEALIDTYTLDVLLHRSHY